MQTFAEKLKKLRKEKGNSQQMLAAYIGVSRSAVAQWENGNNLPTAEFLKKIAKYYNVSADYLLEDDKRDLLFTLPNIYPASDMIRLPVVATISAGYNSISEVYEDEKEYVSPSMLKGYKPDEIMLMRVKGNSMYPRIMDWDIVVVHRQSSVDPGDIAVVIYESEEATIKKVNYVYGEDWLELIPFNPEYETKTVRGTDLDQCRVIGKVISLMRVF